MTKQFLQLFAGTFCISLFVLMMQFLWRYVDELIGKGLSLDVLAQFFWYMGLMLIPQAFPLAVLLASLITMGNIGENSELTAIKAAGISLMQALRPMMYCAITVMCVSFYFQNYIGPMANRNLQDLLAAMKEKSPELEIPEGIFYDGIPNCNLYVQKKDLETGKLYGVMIYRITNSFDDAAIILADSGMLQTTADKAHLLLTLNSGEWFENMSTNEVSGNSNVPYRRESFSQKKIVLDFDNGLDVGDNGQTSPQAKNISQIYETVDSMYNELDSCGKVLASFMKSSRFLVPEISKKDSLKAIAKAMSKTYSVDSVVSSLSQEERRSTMQRALSETQMAKNDLLFYSENSKWRLQVIRVHWIELVNKFTLSLTCLIFFFIGAPLGAIIRKGGLGVPVIISVFVFIVFYILDNTGYRMSRLGEWPIWFGKGLAPAVLIPLAAFVTMKANKDSAVFNMDAYRNMMMRLLGLRLKRRVASKEVVINEPDYQADILRLQTITADTKDYEEGHHLKHAPNVIKVFFKYEEDREIPRIIDRLEEVIEDLSNTRDRYIIDYLNRYPVVSEKAHTRPFDSNRGNIIAFCLVPVGAFLYFRMWRFRLRLLHDLHVIRATNDAVIQRINEMNQKE